MTNKEYTADYLRNIFSDYRFKIYLIISVVVMGSSGIGLYFLTINVMRHDFFQEPGHEILQ